jgi:polar amino acid transport system substrate-binding protein
MYAMTTRAWFAALTALLIIGTVAGCSSGGGDADPSAAAGSTNEFSPQDVQPDPDLAAKAAELTLTPGMLIVGSDTTYPPYEQIGADGTTPEGIDVDLAKAIANKLDLDLSYQTAAFDSILPAIGSKYDLGISAFTITNERYGAVDFVTYIEAGSQWAVKQGNPSGFDPANVCGAKVGVQTGTTNEQDVQAMSQDCVSSGREPLAIMSLKSQNDIITRLSNGALDATYAGSNNVGHAAEQSNGQIEVIGEIIGANNNGIAVKKGDTALSEVIAGALNDMIADGDYVKILENWGVQHSAITEAQINPVVEK